MLSSSTEQCSLTIPNDPTTSTGPLTPENVNLTHSAPEPPRQDDRPLSPTIFTNGRDPVNISAKHLKEHPLHEPTGTSEVLTFYPTLEEFKDFSRYIKKVETAGAHLKSGIAKVVAPEGWSPRPSKSDYSDVDDYEILSPTRETIEMEKVGVYSKQNVVCKKRMSVREFKATALSPKYRNPRPDLTGAESEKFYFDNLLVGEPIYGADTEGTFYDKDIKEWNMNNLGTVLNEIHYEIKGVNTVYLYFGMYKTTFPWHAEDMDLYSINFLHFGAPKYWFAISSEHADRFERFMTQMFSVSDASAPCRAFLRHKTCIVTPKLLREANIPYATMIQRPHEFIITFPRGYHMGYNQGYNLAESTNFASDRWIDYGKDAILCNCNKTSVKIEMRPYMKKYRSEEEEKWRQYWYDGGRLRWVVQKKKKTAAASRKRKADDEADDEKAKKLRASSEGSSSSSEFLEELKGYSLQDYSLTADHDDLMRRFKRDTKGLQNNKVDFYAEKKYNESRSREWPHCSVCQYFQPTHITATRKTVPEQSRRLIPSSCFSKTDNKKEDKEEMDRLLYCSNCWVCVHSKCCSGGQPDSDGSWKCARCLDRNATEIRLASCQLCTIRGGVLIRCQIGKDETWAHVICALFNRRATFDRPIGPTSCSVEPLPRQLSESTINPPLAEEYRSELGDTYEHSRWECSLCLHIQEGLTPCALCISENPNDVMPTLAHITCARRVGYACEIRDFPRGTVMICHKHEQSYLSNRTNQNQPSLKVGDTVYVDDESSAQKKIVQGKIIVSTKVEAVVVDFLDNSCSRDNRSEDIQSCECLHCENGDHQHGARVKVLWDDKKIYNAYYRGKGKMHEYTIELEDGREVKTIRSKLRSKREFNNSLKN